MCRLLFALAGILLAAPAFAQQAVQMMYQSGAAGSAAVPVSPTAGLPIVGLSEVAQGSTTAGQSGALVQGAVTTAVPTYTTAQTAPLSLTTGGALRMTITNAVGATALAAPTNVFGGVNSAVIVAAYYTTAPAAITNGASSGLLVDARGNLKTTAGGISSSLNITAATTVKSGVGRVYRVVLNTVGATATSIIDSASTTVTAANTILTIPATATAGTVFLLDWPCAAGLSVVPGTSAVLSVSFD